MKQFKIKDSPGLMRDGYSKAIINTDLALLEEHKRRQQTQRSVNDMNREINNLKSDISEIKNMLALLLKK